MNLLNEIRFVLRKFKIFIIFYISEKFGDFWIQTLFNCELIGLDQAIENLTDYTDDEAHLLLKEYKNLFSNDQRLIFLIDHIDNIFSERVNTQKKILNI